jgi:carboxylesterase type B
MCQQTFYTEDDDDEVILNGVEDCLVMNILVPLIANATNLLPAIVYIHSGAFAGGSANMGKLYHVAHRDIIAISFNYRVGALGFACLGTEEIPGNAGLKDQLAALKWINKNIKKFGGDPNKITLAGFSVGATMAELHAISKHTDGLFNKLILDSGSALAPFAVNRDPVSTAKNIALSMGYNGTGDVKELTKFYLEAPIKYLASKSVNFFLPNSTFGFSPCIETLENNPQPFLTESPLDTIKRGDVKQLSVLSGFANMEGLSRSIKFQEWLEMMNKNFGTFLPADLTFNDAKTKNSIVKEVRDRYFKEPEITSKNKQNYVDYFSDSMFKYPIMKSAKLHAGGKGNTVYLYEFSYVGQLNTKHFFMDSITGASHRDQTAYIWDLLSFTNSLSDFDTRGRLTYMWTDFAKYG